MDFSQLKAVTLCSAVIALVGCSTASKTTEYVHAAPLQVVSMADDAQLGDRVLLPTNSGLGRDSVVVDQSYVSASGRQCRRLRTVDGRPIQRVACQVGAGVWSLARDLRPVSSTNPTSFDNQVVRHTTDFSQPLIPSVGSAMLLKEQDSLSSNTISQNNVEALVTTAAELSMQDNAERSEIGFAEPATPVGAEPVFIVPAEYAETVEAMPLPISVAETQIQSNVEPLIVSSNEYVPAEYVAPLEALPPEIGAAFESSELARAEALIISPEQHSEQVGAPLLFKGFDDNTALVSGELISNETSLVGVDAFEIETVTRVVNANETLWSFAKRTTGNALNWETIAQINGISDAKTLTSGAQLLIPIELVGQGS